LCAQLGKKFGCPASDAGEVLQKAFELDMNVIGVSFHVGSGCFDASAFSEAIAVARDVFDEGARVGYHFSLLDVGGGFPGDSSAPVSFASIAPVLNEALDKYFPSEMGVKFMAEPGRYYVASAGTLAVNVVSKRKLKAEQPGEKPTMFYYVNDGAYGTLNNVIYDPAGPLNPVPLHPSNATTMTSTLWGPTCDSMDCITRTAELPEMNIGDWITFKVW
jgi:ornithine decarboxylase